MFLEAGSVRGSRLLKLAALSRDAATDFEPLPYGSLLFVTLCEKSRPVPVRGGDGPIRPTSELQPAECLIAPPHPYILSGSMGRVSQRTERSMCSKLGLPVSAIACSNSSFSNPTTRATPSAPATARPCR